MRKRVLLLACVVGVLNVAAFSPQAHAADCVQIKIGDRYTRCVEDIICGLIPPTDPTVCPLTS